MNKKIIWGIVIVVIVIIAGWLLFRSSKPTYTCWPYCPNMTDQDRVAIRNQIDALESSTTALKTYVGSNFQVQYPNSWTKYEGVPESTVVSFIDPHTNGEVTNSFAVKNTCQSTNTDGWVPMGEAYTKILCINGFGVQAVYSDIQVKNTEDQMIQSIKFTSSTSKASNWKTYSDSVFGLSVNYPINWAVSSDAKGDPRYNVSIYDQNQPVGQAHIYNSFNIAGNENCASVVTNGWTNDGTYKFIKKVCFVEKRLLLTLIAPDEATKTIEDAVLESVKFTN